MADPICRWRNSSIKQLNEFNLLFPLEVVSKTEGRKIVEKNWALLGGRDFFNTPYQLAAQMGVYYEDDSNMYPRFNSIIDLNACFEYMQNWGRKYYAPNPYTRSMQSQQPIAINNFLVNWVIEHGTGCDFKSALQAMFTDTIGNTDILINMVNNFMDVTIEDDKLFIKDNVNVNLYPHDEVYLSYNPDDKKAFFDHIGKIDFQQRSSDLIIFQFDDPTEFVWECIKLFNKNNELNILFKSNYRSAGGSLGNYIRINGCYVAQQGKIENLDCILTETDGVINNGFDARNVDAFADAVNDIYKDKYKVLIEGDLDEDEAIFKLIQLQPQNIDVATEYTPYLTALRTKPFMLLAGISGTGKSRIAREIAKACWPVGSEQREKQVPDNFCMVQVKPNWHDSTELLGYVSRIGGEKYVTGDLLPFIAKAWENPSVPYILCLDEMNLAPVEQYFAEYLSVIESRRVDYEGKITTDSIVKKDKSDWFRVLTAELTNDDNLRAKFLEEGISIPQNLFVVGTVNMDETTFSFSRKVLDRAMTIEMNEVDLRSNLSEKPEGDLGYISNILLSNAAKGTDVYISNQALCDSVVEYLEKVNAILDGSPFKIAYRTRNEFMLYTVNRAVIETESPLWKSLDEMTSMKILSRIEGDEERCKVVLNKLNDLLKEQFAEHLEESISIKKVNEMIKKMSVGYTSYWT